MKPLSRDKGILKTTACQGPAGRTSGRLMRGIDIVLQCTAQSDWSVNTGCVDRDVRSPKERGNMLLGLSDRNHFSQEMRN